MHKPPPKTPRAFGNPLSNFEVLTKIKTLANTSLIQSGWLAAISAYTLWGLFPIYFKQIEAVPATEILVHRVIWSMPFLAFYLWRKKIPALARLQHHRTALSLFFSALLIASNWLIFVMAVNSGQTLAASYGYFINPLMMIVIGVLVLKDRLNRLQQFSLGLVTIAVAYQTYIFGHLPWISLSLAATFAGYGLIRKTAAVSSVEGLFIETLFLAPLGLTFLAYQFSQGKLFFGQIDLGTDLLLVAAGPLTALPLILFTIGARRLRFSEMGYLQYISPTLQFLCGVLLFREPLSSDRLISFGLIWMALGCLIFGSTRLRIIRNKMAAS